MTPVEVAAVEVVAGRKALRLRAPGLKAGMCARLVLDEIVGENAATRTRDPLLHPQIDYTINRLPGMANAVPVAKTVEPPPSREDLEEGWVTLFDRRSIEGFEGEGWRRAAVHMDPNDAARLADHPLVDDWDGMLCNTPGARDVVSKLQHGDCDARIDFMVPKGSNSGVYFMGRYELQILDSFGKKAVDFGDCGGIYEGMDGDHGFPGSSPKVNASNAPGEWQRFDVRFRAPRFDASGKKVANAKFEWVKLNGTLIQENVEVPNPTRGGFDGPEQAFGPLRLQGDHGPVAFKKVRLKRLDPLPTDAVAANANAGFVRIFDGKTIDGWKAGGKAKWSVEDGAIVGRGDAGHLFSPRGDYVNVEQRAKVVINDAGNSGFYFRTQFSDGFPPGYEAQVDSSHPDPQRTGSLYGMAKVTIPLVPPNVWFDYRVRCADEAAGTHIQIWVNGFQTVDFVDKDRTYKSGHLALQQHNEGSEVRFKDIEVKELK